MAKTKRDTIEGEIRLLIEKIASCKDKVEELKNKQSSIQNEIKTYNGMIKTFEKQVHSLRTPAQPKVSEHAFLRYFQRVEGYDLNEIRNKILPTDTLKIIDVLGKSGIYPVENFKVVLKDNTVVTILTGDEKE